MFVPNLLNPPHKTKESASVQRKKKKSTLTKKVNWILPQKELTF
jgi:hypothetical protein